MTNALIVIDVQESFRQQPTWSAISDPTIVDKVSALVEHARAHREKVIWILHTAPGSGTPFDPASGHVRTLVGLEPRDDEPVLYKTSANAFTTTALGQLLTRDGIREITICGIKTEQCCETTARLGRDLGYQVTFAIDATATFPIPHPAAPAGRPLADVLADPTTLSTSNIIERTAYALAGRFARIATVAELTGRVPAVAG